MAPKRTVPDPATNGDMPPAADEQLRDALIVHTADGGRTFGYAIPADCGVSPFAWPAVLRAIAGRIEDGLKL
jgi:hypothetical protein